MKSPMKTKLGLLLVALLALSLLATLVGCGSDSKQASVTDSEKAVIQKLVAAHLSDDETALAGLFAKDAILSNHLASTTVEGRDKIVDYIAGYSNLDWQLNGEPFKVDDYVVQAVTLLIDGTPTAPGVHVYDINGDGQITHFWVTVPATEE